MFYTKALQIVRNPHAGYSVGEQREAAKLVAISRRSTAEDQQTALWLLHSLRQSGRYLGNWRISAVCYLLAI